MAGPVKSKLTTKEIFTLREKGMTYRAIAGLAGITHQGVQNRLRPRYNPTWRSQYRHRPEQLAKRRHYAHSRKGIFKEDCIFCTREDGETNELQ